NPGTGADVATWTFSGLTPGRYRVSATWTPYTNRATDTPFTVLDGGTPLGTVRVNQKLTPDDFSDQGLGWEDLGGPYSTSGTTLVVRLTDAANAQVIADAVRIERIGDLTSTGPTSTYYVSNNQEINQALPLAKPGTRILLRPGIYSGDIYLVNMVGAPGSPILFGAADPTQRPVIRGGLDGIHLVDPQYVEISDLILDGAYYNGVNVDDGGTYDTPAHHVTLRNLDVRNVVGTANSNGLKLSGVDQFSVVASVIDGWGSWGSGIDLVGSHDGAIATSTFRNAGRGGANGFMAKGGSARIVLRDSRFEQAGYRAVQIGGSTYLPYFRPAAPVPYEAKDITVEGNVIIGSEAAVAFVNVDGATVRYNTIYRPTTWAFRILQEVNDPWFVPCRNGVITDNIIAYRSTDMYSAVNIGGNTAPETFLFARNDWCCLDAPSRSRPSLPTAEINGVYGVDPLFVAAEAGDLHLLAASTVRNQGAYAPRA
ncbi:MAG TPA: hypothetical protein VF590_08740, partial [Isosphaeraceae bacterium]